MGSVRFLIHHTDRCPASVQRSYVQPDDVVYEVGKNGVERADWRDGLRAADVAKVTHISLIAVAGRRVETDALLRYFREDLAKVRAAGAVFLEAATGRRSDVPGEYEAMLLDALEQIRTRLWGGKRAGAGRPKEEFASGHLDLMALEWDNSKNATREAAVAAIASRGIVTLRGEAPNLANVRRALKRAGRI